MCCEPIHSRVLYVVQRNVPSTAQRREEQEKWEEADAKAASLIGSVLSKSVADLVLSCTTSNENWLKLCARFERKSTQRLNMLIEMFFQARRDESEDTSSHVAKLQNLFVDLNNELEKHNENRLSQRMLTGRILSTLGKSHDHFKDVWDTIPEDNQTVNLLVEKLCNIELRETKSTDNGQQSAFFSRKAKKSSAGKGPQKCVKDTERAKQRFPCNKRKKLGHWAAECPQKKDKDSGKKVG
ncbi:hypothetical protein X777_14531 [Ooceraea biroi]|uniref:Copia protein n=1 Tax=Ooceraea biroi TaxID=2015173 RepID=A0A026VW16_OOCBI|nr:hypothetical protein X777_14531 [Ooceraea biroi]